jgi:hypothetical protein
MALTMNAPGAAALLDPGEAIALAADLEAAAEAALAGPG